MTKYIKNGKKLGVLGGLGPAAAAEFLRQLAQKCPATIDQEHPVVYMIGDCEIPDRGTAICGQGPSPLPKLKEDLLKLCELGADVLAVPCNTAHYFIDQFADELPVPLVHIIESTVLATKAIAPHGAWMLSTKGTRACGLYQKYAEMHGLKLFIPNEEQSDKSQQVINFVKANRLAEAGALCRELVEELWQEHDVPVMTACTELPLGYDASGLPQERSVSSIGALVEATVKKLYDVVEE
ncbi:MAG: amino acid racemase [Phascolarctobacterium sp.]|nr:amino acid racemase [Phascolarctobacterium sp.]